MTTTDGSRLGTPKVGTALPGPESRRLFERADEGLLGVAPIGGHPPNHLLGASPEGPREALAEIAPAPLTKVVYDTTGSEVVENAVRIMREAAGPSRPFVITFYGSFHGGKYGTGAMGPHNAHYNHRIAPV